LVTAIFCGLFQAQAQKANIQSAISYLKKYFIVLACDANTEWTQKKIEEI
jgi:hypothetical protein